jgi:hypothetical protein
MSSAEISCHFGDFGDFGNAAPGVAVSSVLALCETPARDKSRHPEVRVGVASDGVYDARTANYAYRVSVSDAVGFFDDEEDDDKTKRRAPGDHSSTVYGSASGGAVVDARLGTTTGALARSAQCAFGATWVSARSGEGETNDGAPLFGAGGRRRDVRVARRVPRRAERVFRDVPVGRFRRFGFVSVPRRTLR